MKAKLYLIQALSNIHVGSGEINYGLIDNLIQRDPITELPNINSSSLKGALREYFNYLEKKGENKDAGGNILWTVRDIFGSEPKEDDATKRQQGSVRFFEAELLSIPVRSDKIQYEIVTSVEIIKSLKEKLESFGCCDKENEILKNLRGVIKQRKKNEDCSSKLKMLEILFGSPLRLAEDHDQFKQYCSDEELPVISRNNLENGQSANLWYEQVLPKQSRLSFIVMGDENRKSFNAFCEKLNNSQLQIGANATIGYGYCKITDVFSTIESQENEEDK